MANIIISPNGNRSVTIDHNGTVKHYDASFRAYSGGDNVFLWSEAYTDGYRAPFYDISVNGTIYPDAAACVAAINEFAGNFKRGGSTSSTTTTDISGKADLDASKRFLKAEQLNPLGPVAGADTTSGCFKLKGAAATALNFTGDRTVRCLFRTNGDTVSAGYPFSQKEGYSSSMAIRCGDNILQVQACGQTFSLPLSPNTLYNVEITKRGEVGGEVETVVNGVSFGKKTIASVSLYVPTDISIGRRDADAGGLYNTITFQGEVFIVEVFNYARSSAEMLASWNDGDPYLYRLPRSKIGAGANMCVAEYLPSGILPDRWRDTSGNGFDLPRLGSFIPTYCCPHDAREVVVDSGVFYTDIAAGVAGKVLTVPYGYYLDRVCVCNYNAQNLTAITAQLGAGPVNFLANQSTATGYGAIITGNLFQSNNTTPSIQAQLMPRISSNRVSVTINATGNTADGGMRVKLICRWAGL